MYERDYRNSFHIELKQSNVARELSIKGQGAGEDGLLLIGEENSKRTAVDGLDNNLNQ